MFPGENVSLLMENNKTTTIYDWFCSWNTLTQNPKVKSFKLQTRLSVPPTVILKHYLKHIFKNNLAASTVNHLKLSMGKMNGTFTTGARGVPQCLPFQLTLRNLLWLEPQSNVWGAEVHNSLLWVLTVWTFVPNLSPWKKDKLLPMIQSEHRTECVGAADDSAGVKITFSPVGIGGNFRKLG